MLSALITAGGNSSRMGTHKALLARPPTGQPLLAHVVTTAAAVVDGPIYVVANHPPVQAVARDLPNVTVIADDTPGQGPLAGFAAGLAHIPGWTLVLACDLPLLRVEFLRVLTAYCDPHAAWDAVVPVVEGRAEPLCAAYHRRCLPIVQAMLAQDKLRLRDLLSQIRVHAVEEAELRTVDPSLQSLTNVNTPEEWAAICCRLDPRAC